MRQTRAPLTFLVAALTVVVLATVARGARAASDGADWKRGIVVYVDGAGTERARSELVRAVPGSIPIVRNVKIKKRRGEQLGTILARPARRKAWLKELGQSVEEAGAEGAALLYLGPNGRRGHEERLLIVRGSRPDVLLEQRLTLKAETPEARIQRWKGVIEDVTEEHDQAETPSQTPEEVASDESRAPKRDRSTPSQARPVTPVPPKPQTSIKPSEDVSARVSAPTPEENGRTKPGSLPAQHRNWLALSAGYEWGARFFRHSEPTTRSERSYTARGINSAVFGLNIYPFVASDEGLWQSFSIDAEYATSIALKSPRTSYDPNATVKEDPVVSSRWYRYGLGVHARLPLDALPRDVWGLVFGFGYSEWAFTFDAPTSTGRIAAEDYYFIRPEFGFEVRGTRLRVQATASYLHLLSVDKLGTRNPEGWQGGLDARLTSSFRITDFLEVGASAAYARFFFKLHPIPAREAEDEPGHVADDYLRLSVFTRFAF